MKDKRRKRRETLLEFRDITVVRADKKVLDGVSIKIYEGEHVAILGPNGAGKSSFIKTITREYYPLQEADDTLFKIWGADDWNVFDLKTKLGIVSNDLQYSFVKEMSGMEVVLSGFFSSIGLYFQAVTPMMRKKAEQIIDFLEIGHLKNRNMTEMSSGEARRFLIGRAIVHDPKALILDEPTNSLDLHALHKFRQLIGKISRAGIGVIIVTNNLMDIIPEISRVILMREGRFYKDGPKGKIITDENMSELYKTPVKIKKVKGYYYAFTM